MRGAWRGLEHDHARGSLRLTHPFGEQGTQAQVAVLNGVELVGQCITRLAAPADLDCAQLVEVAADGCLRYVVSGFSQSGDKLILASQA